MASELIQLAFGASTVEMRGPEDGVGCATSRRPARSPRSSRASRARRTTSTG